MNKQNTLKGMAWLTVSLFVISVALFVYAKYIEQPYLFYQNRPFPSIFKKIEAGSLAPYEVERCNTSEKTQTYKITRRLVHLPKPNEVQLPDVLFESMFLDIEPGCHRDISKLSTPPAVTPPGTWMARGIAIVPGTFRTFQIPWYSEPFEVTKKFEVKP
jgi:hypothetical protein